MPDRRSRLLPVLIFAALCTAIVSSLGMLLVPTVSAEFGVTIATAQWMLTINLLVGAVATPVMGRLSDGPHTKRILMISLTVVLAGSVLAALAPSFGIFLLGRALQGLTYGIVPVTIALAKRHLPAPQVSRAISGLSVTVASGIGIGYPLTGLIAGLLDHRLAFWFAALFVASSILVVGRSVPAGPDPSVPRHPFDLVGAVLLGLGLGALLLAISEGPTWGWGSPVTIGLFLAAVLVLAIWVASELRSDHPLIDVRVLAEADVLLANTTAIGLGTALYMGLSLGSLIAQSDPSTGYGIGLPVLWAGFVMFPLSVGSFAANRLMPRITARMGMTTLLPIGAAVVTTSSILLWLAHDALWEILLGMLLFGVGIGTAYAAMPALIARSVADRELGSAVSFNQVLRTVGGSCGSAISGAVLAAHIGPGRHPSSQGIDLALFLSAAGCAVVLLALLLHRLRSGSLRSVPGD